MRGASARPTRLVKGGLLVFVITSLREYIQTTLLIRTVRRALQLALEDVDLQA